MQFYLMVTDSLPHYISESIYLVACEQALLGVGGGRGKEDPPPRELARRLSIWGNWRCWRLSLLKDCRLYAPHSQIWPEYKLETASCFIIASVRSPLPAPASVHVSAFYVYQPIISQLFISIIFKYCNRLFPILA